MKTLRETLQSRIEDRSAVVAVVGLGYVGLPLALAFVESGFLVVGIDVDQKIIDSINEGHSHVNYIEDERVARAVANGNLLTASSPSASDLPKIDCYLVCVPTPLSEHREPDLKALDLAVHSIAPFVQESLVVIESTSYPGTTDTRVMLSLLDSSVGQRFLLAYSPEREDPGRPIETKAVPKVVGGVDDVSCQVAALLYRQVFDEVITVSSARTAEATKLMENIFRSVNIALVNELKWIYESLSIDIWEVLDAAESKPYGYKRFNPGPGVGGHCIPCDPFYLSWAARAHGHDCRFVELAGQINRAQPKLVVRRVQDALNANWSIPMCEATILLFGVTYKGGVADVRESPALDVWRGLEELGARVLYSDPLVPELCLSWTGATVRTTPVTPDSLSSASAVVVLADHPNVNWEHVARHARLVVDTRHVVPSAENVVHT